MVRRDQLNTVRGGGGNFKREGGVGGIREGGRGRKPRERERGGLKERGGERENHRKRSAEHRQRKRELTIPLFTLLIYSFWQYTES